MFFPFSLSMMGFPVSHDCLPKGGCRFLYVFRCFHASLTNPSTYLWLPWLFLRVLLPQKMVEAKPNHRHTFSMSNHHSNLPAFGGVQSVVQLGLTQTVDKKTNHPNPIRSSMLHDVPCSKCKACLLFDMMVFDPKIWNLVPVPVSIKWCSNGRAAGESQWQWQWPIERAAHRTENIQLWVWRSLKHK
jgi:hypothetical protein